MPKWKMEPELDEELFAQEVPVAFAIDWKECLEPCRCFAMLRDALRWLQDAFGGQN